MTWRRTAVNKKNRKRRSTDANPINQAAEDSGAESHTAAVRLASFERSPKMSEIKAVYRSRGGRRDRTQILSTEVAVAYLRAIWNKDTIELTEDFLIVCLDAACQVIGWVKISSGGFDSVTVDPRLVFSLALQVGTTG